MITNNLPALRGCTAILLPDDGALLAMAEHGADALDWLFLSGARVYVPEAVHHEIVRDRGPGEDDYAPRERPVLALWFERNGDRIRVLPDDEVPRHRTEQERWRRSGRAGPAPDRDWDDDPRASMAAAAVDAIPGPDRDRVLVVANHDATRAAMRGLPSDVVALTGTTRFFGMIAAEFKVDKAARMVSRDV
jgi:hypothetical protein